jgi:hypothetical protein
VSFKAATDEGKVNITWTTAEEKDNDFFTVERSSDGKTFDKILNKKGAGNSSNIINYSMVDNDPPSGTIYYRLKQTDFDGKHSYSKVVTVKTGSSNNDVQKLIQLKSCGPNPFNDSFKLNYTLSTNSEVNVSILNLSGQLLAQEKVEGVEGYNTYEFVDHYNLSKGVYLINLTCNGESISQKMVKN